ncbi:hypothetical protein JOQ06_011412 [Pogonophryne albipinna]|uniref:CCHC-type domain-containing protein n=1 Tax=Pogonophryne albipinna TaxID=1090488 RepID=A0AAD6BBC8_9TELE|nr:hypothetical protein JOQ06_011412 [Pogonophryne albipinna]
MTVNIPNRPLTDSEERFCYRCGENGHMAGKCRNPENQNKVIQRLIQALKKAKTNTTGEAAPKDNTSCTVRKSAVDMLDSCGITEGLIGPPSLEPVKVNGHLCDALLDIGSRVSIIFESWYRRYLSDTQIHPVKKLDIWGFGDSSYPYLGYVVVDLEFPKKVAGTPTVMSALALICPDPPGPDQTPVLIGTNTKASLAKRLAQLCEDTTGVFVALTFGIRNTCTEKEKEIRTTELKGEEDDEVGCVKWEGPGPLTLPAGSSGKVICKVEIKQPLPNEILMVEASLTNPLPAGVLLQPMVIPSIAVDVNQFIVLVQNESLKDATIPVGTVLGHLCVTDVVTTASKQQPVIEDFNASSIDFGESPIPEVWKTRLRQKLSKRANVFSLDELDVGLAKEVEHTIRLSDPRPFREQWNQEKERLSGITSLKLELSPYASKSVSWAPLETLLGTWNSLELHLTVYLIYMPFLLAYSLTH